MQIGVIGAGHVGGTLAGKLVRSGHEVGIANAHGPATLRELIAELGEHACPLSVDEAASFGEVVIVSIPFGAYEKLPSAAARRQDRRRHDELLSRGATGCIPGSTRGSSPRVSCCRRTCPRRAW